MAKKTGLGKGFGALLPDSFDHSLLLDEKERIQKLLIQDIIPNPQQPRTTFDKTELDLLSQSIKRYGILQPLIATNSDGGKYILIAGERRWRAAKIAGHSHVPVIVRTSPELEQLEIALIENVQRTDLSPLDQAVSIARLIQQFNLSYQEISDRLGKATSTLSNLVRLLQLPQAARLALEQKKISEGHARAILALEKETQQLELLELIKKNNWTVRQAEQYVVAHKQGLKTPAKATQRLETSTEATKKLSKFVKAPVSLRRTAKGGKLEIGFKSDKDLERIINKLSE